MKLTTFKLRGEEAPRFGILAGDSVIDVHAADPALPDSFRAYLTQFASDIAPLKKIAASPPKAAVRERAAVTLLPPIPDPGKFFCVGKNNKEHLAELKRNQLLHETPTEPTGFLKLNSVLVGDGARVARPDGILEFDYEPEMAFVIGRHGYRVSKAEAMNYVFGLTMLNDLTAREVQKREVAMSTRFLTAKNMPGFGPVGPCVVTLDEIGSPDDLWLTCSVNGKPRMRVHTGGLIFKIPDIIEHYSRYMTIEPGDVFSTGSAGGVAVGQPNAADLYLKPGDTIEVACDKIGTLTTYITEPAAR